MNLNNTFDFRRVGTVGLPLKAFEFDLKHIPSCRMNHCCVKLPGSLKLYKDILPGQITEILKEACKYCVVCDLEFLDRYIFITVDTVMIQPGKSQRTPGWHIDGMQGDEVPVKLPIDFQFIGSNKLPTQFLNQSFDLSAFNPSEHNLFKVLESQADEKKIVETKANQFYFMTPYDVHRGQVAQEEIVDRIFVRLSFTHVPVTSKKMTLNPTIDYGYPVHSTPGEIPRYLK